MDDKKGSSIPGGIFQRIRKTLLFFLKGAYLLPFIVFGAWLISHVYVSGFDVNKFSSVSSEVLEDNLLANILQKKETVPRDHFHMVDEYVETQDPNPPVCVICHGAYAHGKEKKVRSFLNFHSGFIACSVCHVRKTGDDTGKGGLTGGEDLGFHWVNRQTGEFAATAEGAYGKYSSMLYPIKNTGRGTERIFTPIRAEAAQQFLRMYHQLTSDQISEAKSKLHELLSEEPVSCKDCHQKNGYLDFAELGFPPQRVDHLMSSEIVGMIENYTTFHLPSVIDFREE